MEKTPDSFHSSESSPKANGCHATIVHGPSVVSTTVHSPLYHFNNDSSEREDRVLCTGYTYYVYHRVSCLTHNNLEYRGGKWDVRQNFALNA
jgi:hypothetical protein